MQFEFNTNNLNQKLYKKAINHYVIRTMGNRNYRQYRDKLNKWKIKIYPSDQASEDPFFTQDGLGGHVGQNQIKMYVYDTRGEATLIANFGIFSVELAHMIGLVLGWTNKVPLRHDDKGGNKKGTMLARYVAEIHDRMHEGKLWMMRLTHSFSGSPRIVALRVLDLRDLMP